MIHVGSMSTVTVEETFRDNPNPSCQHCLWEETEISGENKRLSIERDDGLFCVMKPNARSQR
jgi:hypothetical protein